MYECDLVRDKCERHLKYCREFGRKERFELAIEYVLMELQVMNISNLKNFS